MPIGALRHVLTILFALGLSALATGAMGWFWMAIGGGPMSIHGWIAMGLGVLGTVGLTWLLMALAFKSHREGWDDQVNNSLDPGRDSARED
jgi:hypothetical protein